MKSGLHNPRMKLMVSLAAQSVLRPLCLRRLPTAYANVRRKNTHYDGHTSQS